MTFAPQPIVGIDSSVLIKSFKINRFSFIQRVYLPLITAGIAVFVVLLISTAITGNNRRNDPNYVPDSELVRAELNQMILSTTLVVFPIVFGAISLPLSLMRPYRVDIYEDKICFNGTCRRWDELESLLLMTDVATITLSLQAFNGTVLKITKETALISDMVDLIKKKTIEKWLPRFLSDFHAGKVVRFGNVEISSETIQQNGRRIELQTLQDYVVKDQLYIFRAKENVVPQLIVILDGLPNIHLFPVFLKAIWEEKQALNV